MCAPRADASAGWPSPWPSEDGGPRRLQVPQAPEPRLELDHLAVTSREVAAATMVVLRDPGEVYLLRHTAGDDAISWVERVDPLTLDPLARSDDLPGGPAWPGGLAAHVDGSLHVAFGNHLHRLSPTLDVEARATMPRRRPYNSFVTLPDGHLVTKDFGGTLPGDAEGSAAERRAGERAGVLAELHEHLAVDVGRRVLRHPGRRYRRRAGEPRRAPSRHATPD